MKTNDQIFSEISENCFITYKQIGLLKNRSNKEQKDCINYDSFEGFGIDPESGAKGLSWLKSLLNRNGEPKKGVSLGYREINIINNASINDFIFNGFYDSGNRYYKNFQPIYRLNGMEYIPYCNGEKIYIIR